jgi:hypothetical protein
MEGEEASRAKKGGIELQKKLPMNSALGRQSNRALADAKCLFVMCVALHEAPQVCIRETDAAAL